MSSAGLEVEIGDCAVAAKATPSVDDMHVKEEEEQEQEEDHEEKSRPSKRKRGGMAKALQQYSIWTAGSRQPNAESLTGASFKRQRKTSLPGTREQWEGGGTAAPHMPPTRTTAQPKGRTRRFCQGDGCTTSPSYGNAPSKKAEFCSKHAEPG
ncbi:unnamed protein product, partial [Ectocarpus sp. 6 AP-2014]